MNDIVSRRMFLGGLAAIPVAARLGAESMQTESRSGGNALVAPSAQKVVVIGAGAFGGWTALQLRRRGAQVTLLDAWGPGNSRASSGGETRVIRAIYGRDRVYVEMVKRAYELWTMLDASTDVPLYVETGALWMHRADDAYVQSALPILHDLGFPVDHFSVADAAKRYPQINFDGVQSTYLERRAGSLSARLACIAVKEAFEQAGGTYRLGRVVPDEVVNGAMKSVRLEDGSRLEADVFVFACGPWLGKLFPDLLGDAIHPTRQEVFYFGVPAGSDRFLPGRMPVWIDFGERILYGIPDVHGRGFKVADDTRGETIDPTTLERKPSEAALTRARQLLSERFPELAKAPLLESRVCQYENSPDGHLILDHHPEAKNVYLVGGGSGHGFKLSPAVGEITADWIVTGKAAPELFRLSRLRDAKKPSTQFERK